MTDEQAELHGVRSQAEAHHLQSVVGAFRRRYARGFFADVVLQMFAVMALIEAIFLAERFTTVFRVAIEKDANLFDISLVLGCTSTEILDLALAIAVLMAVYWTALQMRENRELLVLFAAGIGPFQLTALIMIVGVVAQSGSLFISGVVDPASRFAERAILFDAEFRALRSGITKGQFYYFPEHVAFAPAQLAIKEVRTTFLPGEFYFLPSFALRLEPKPMEHDRRLFVFEQQGPDTSRVITADRAQVDGPDAAGKLLLRLGEFSSHTFTDVHSPDSGAQSGLRAQANDKCADCLARSRDVPPVAMHVRNMTQQMTVDQLLPFPPRGSEPIEQTVFEQLSQGTDSTSSKHLDAMLLLGARFVRSLLCLMAPLIALAFVCLTTRFMNFLALPLACMFLMSLDLASEWLIRTIAPTGPAMALTVPALITAAVMAVLLIFIIRRQGELVRPQLARP